MIDKDKLIYELTEYIDYVDAHVDVSCKYVKYDKHFYKLLGSLTDITNKNRELINKVIKDKWREEHQDERVS